MKKNVALPALLLLLLLLAACSNEPSAETGGTTGSVPQTTAAATADPTADLWEGKLPEAYSWAEFTSLSDVLQEQFFEWFASAEDFEAWRGLAQFEDTYGQLPWNHGGKEPDLYTWEEFEALSDAHQEMFYEWFETDESFHAWMDSVR